MKIPKIFEHAFEVAPADIDRMGHVNNVVYLRYAQDVAVAHWKAAAPAAQAKELVWVARRHEIDYLRPGMPGDLLVARTWVGASSGATFERFIEIHRPADATLLAKVRSVWVPLDPKTLRPRRVSEDLRAPFEEDAPSAKL